MKPILFASTETSFATNGIGILGDCISGIAIEERNGMYEIEIEYPIFGIHYKDIVPRSLIAAKPNPTTAPQPFRVYDISAPMSGVVTVYARHICYDLAGIPIDPFTASGVVLALQRIKQNAAIDCPFEFWTDKSTAGNMTVSVPSAAWSLMGGSEGGILDVYGGEYEFDRYTVKLHNQRGQDRGVTIRYGKNLTDLNQERNCEAMYTGVYPYWADMDGNLMTLPEKTVHAKGTYDFERIMPLDLSAEWQERPTAAQLRARAESFVKDNNIGVPKVSLKISFVQLEQTEEYKNMALLERVSLCDTVSVAFPDMGVSAKAKAIRTVYNFIDERYESVELGDARTNMADVIVAQGQQIDKVSSSSYLQQAVDRATNWIVNGKGHMVAVKDDEGRWREICSLDDLDITQAVNVWRWNNGGFGHSKNGYNGPYETAITQDGTIVADFIKAGTMEANRIKGGTLTLGGKDNGNGVLQVLDAKGNVVATLSNDGLLLRNGDIVLSGMYEDGGKTYFYDSKIVDGKISSSWPTFQSGIRIRSTPNSANDLEYELCRLTNSQIKIGQEDSPFSYMQLFGDEIHLKCKTFRAGTSNDAYAYVNKLNALQTTTSTLTVSGSTTLYELNTTGSKKRVVDTVDYGVRSLYCYEMPSPMFGDIGEGRTDETGICCIDLDDIFAETVSAGIEYQVFLQAEGAGSLWVSQKTPQFFVVKGTKNLKFAWEIKVKQRDYECERLEVLETDENQTEEIDYDQQYADELEQLIQEQEEMLYETT